MKLERKTEEQIEVIVRAAVDDAMSFMESEINPDRDKSQRYYNGECDVPYDKDRSKVIATKCRDVVRQVKPSLMRVFLSSGKMGEFIPRTPQDVKGAEQATSYVEYKLNQHGGYGLLNNAFQDALVKRAGILKAFYEEKQSSEYDSYTGLTKEQFTLIAKDSDVKVIEHTETVSVETLPDGSEVEITTHDAKVEKVEESGDICIVSVPPEDFFVDGSATCVDDAYVIGHKTDMRVGDLVSMGFDFEDVVHLGEDDEADDEADFARKGHANTDDDSHALDPTMRPVTVYEAYMRMDIEGTGIPRLYSFILAGAKKELLDHSPCDMLPFAVFEVDPEPHAFFGASLVDLLINDQDVMTSLWRGLIDNVNLSNNPGAAFDEKTVNVDDLLNNEVGRLVRTKGSPGDKIMPLVVPFSAGATIPAMEYYDQLMQDKTGVSRASMGLDPDALQNTTATAVNAAVGASEGQIEAMARNLAEGGLTQLYKIMYHLAIQHADAEEMILLDGQYVPVDPRSWTADADVTINVGLGRGGKGERMATLQQTLQNQFTIWQTYGPQNGIVTLTQIRNTLADIQRCGGIYNAERYYAPMDEKKERILQMQAQQQAAQAAQGQPDPTQAIMAAEQIKANAKLQSDGAKIESNERIAMMEEARKRFEMGMTNDLERDKMVQDLAIEVAKVLGQYGASVDVAAVTAAQNAPREVLG